MLDQTSYGAYHFSDFPSLYEPQRSNTFRFIIPDMGSLLKPWVNPNTEVQESDYLDGEQSSEILSLSIVRAPIPNFEINPVEIRRGNSVMKFAGLPSFPSGEVVVRDFIGADPLSILQSWHLKAYNPKTQLIGKMSDYKRDCYLVQYDVDFTTVVHKWLLKGCWISNLSQDAVDVENGDARLITATIQYDSGMIDSLDNV